MTTRPHGEGAPPLAGVDVGGTHVRVGLVEGDAVVWEHRHAAHFARRCRADRPAESLAFVLESLTDAVRALLDRRPDVAAVGVALPGFFEAASGRLTSSPNLPGIHDVDLATLLAERLGRVVVTENDALCAAWGEHGLEADPPPSLIYVGLGTGVGGGLVLEGRPYRGGHGFAMEVGHVIVEPGGRLCGCGNRGCLERYASATGVRVSYVDAGGDALEAHEIAGRARAGDVGAQAAFERAGLELAGVLAHVMKTIDVPDIVFGGGLSASWDLMGPTFERRLDSDLLPVMRGRFRVRVSTSGDRAGMLGAAWLGAGALDRG